MNWRLKGLSDSPIFTFNQLQTLAGKKKFQLYKRNPILSPGNKGTWDAGALGSMSVVKVKDIFHLYYEAWGIRSKKHWSQNEYNSLQIGHATSLDGLHWVKDPNNPVVPKGKENDDWDNHGTWDPFVIYEDGMFKMWYGGGNEECDWGYATSLDGTHFTKHGRISRLGKVEDDHIVHDTDHNIFHLYYWDRAHEPMGLYRATSINEKDFDFQHAQMLIIEGEQYPAMYKFSHVFIEKGLWYMLYSNFLRPNCPNSTVRLAISDDGIHWKAVNKNLLKGQDGELVEAGLDLYMLYFGPQNHFDAVECDIRVAMYNGKLNQLFEQKSGKKIKN